MQWSGRCPAVFRFRAAFFALAAGASALGENQTFLLMRDSALVDAAAGRGPQPPRTTEPSV